MGTARYYGLARSPRELEHAYALRRRVFCGEQGVSEEVEFDGLDDAATQLVGLEDGGVVATCRLLFEDGGICRLGRMAVAAERRGSGSGRRLMAAAEKQAREQGAEEIVIHAQRQAEPFYVSRWFVAEGESFDEEGIEHVLMRKRIRRD